MIPFSEWIAHRLGTHKWVVAHRLGSKLALKYDLAITPKRYADLTAEYARLPKVSPSAPNEV